MDGQNIPSQRITADHAKPVEAVMLSKERWDEARQMCEPGISISEIARQLEVDRKRVRKMVTESCWAYERPARSASELLRADFVSGAVPRSWIPRKLRNRQTICCALAPASVNGRTVSCASVASRRSRSNEAKLDRGQIGIYLRSRPVELLIFVLTLGSRRRANTWPAPTSS